MKRMMFGIGATALLLLIVVPLLAGSAEGTAIKLPADIKAYVHIDMEAFARSALGQILLQLPPEHAFSRWRQKIRQNFSFDPLTDFKDVALIDTGGANKLSVGIVRVTDPQKLVDQIKGKPGYTAVTYGKHTVHYWTVDAEDMLDLSLDSQDGLSLDAPADPVKVNVSKAKESDGTKECGAVYLVLHGGYLLLSSHLNSITGMLDVLDGKKPELSQSADNAVVPKTAPGSFISATLYRQPNDNGKEKWMVTRIGLDVGENNHAVFVHGRLAAKKAEKIQQTKTMLDGIKAMALLSLDREKPDDAEKIAAIEAVKLEFQGDEIDVSWSYPVDKLQPILNSLKTKLTEPAKLEAQH